MKRKLQTSCFNRLVSSASSFNSVSQDEIGSKMSGSADVGGGVFDVSTRGRLVLRLGASSECFFIIFNKSVLCAVN